MGNTWCVLDDEMIGNRRSRAESHASNPHMVDDSRESIYEVRAE
jgi:hypothetical protein